jgi:predicted acetyltransferase
VDVRPFRPDDDLEAELDLRRRAFGPISAGSLPDWIGSLQGSIKAGALFGAFDGDRLIGSARYFMMRQWWHGRSLPMAGVAGVKVAPEERGRGVGAAMMAVLLDDIASRGYPLSVLFPSTASVYRRHGWEIAGRLYETVLPAGSLAAFASQDWPDAAVGDASTVRRATPADAALIVDVQGLVHERLQHCGPNTREPWVVRDWLDDEDHFAYVADDGFLSYRWSSDREELDVRFLTAGSATTARAFWQILASNATMASRVRAWVAPDDPVTWLTREPVAAQYQGDIWMQRVVDAPAAIAGRGYPVTAAVSVTLDIADAAVPANAGRWTLSVSGGAGSLTRLGCSPPDPELGVLRLGARGFAALYAGVPIGTLRFAGLATGGDAAIDGALSGAFCGPAFALDRY